MRYQGYFLGIALGAVLQWLTEYLGLALVFVWGGARGGALSFCSVGGAFIVAGGLGAGLSF